MQQFIKIIVLFAIATQVHAKDVYVSTSGSDTNSGTYESPYRTLAKAVSVMSAGDVCIIRGGIYEEELNINKNGTQSANLTFKAAQGEDVQIKATSKLSGWQLHSGNIYKVSVDMQIDSRFRTVYHNGNYMDLARWPNNTDNDRWTVDCHPVSGGDGSHFLANNMPNIDWTGGLVYYLGAHSGASWTRRITNSSSGRIDFTQVDITKWPFSTHNPTQWRNNPNNKRGQLYLFDKFEALDHPREWYYDASSKLLYFYTADGTIPQDNTVEYAARRYTAQIYGDYINIEGIHFYGGSVKIHNKADNNTFLNCTITHGVEGHDSLTNTSAQVGEASLEVLGDNTIIKGCTINYSSVNGIHIHGWAASNCIVEGNTISNIDYIGIHASPIRTGASNMKIIKNTIFNAGRDGIYATGSNSEIAYNDVSATQKINADSGIFYAVGDDYLKNIEIHHNWFHDATAPTYSHEQGKPGKAAGIYLDNDSKGYTVHHNVVWNVSWSGYQVNWNNTHLDFFHNTIWNAERAMDSWDINGPQENNKIYNNYANTGSWFTGTGPAAFDIKNSPIFLNSPFEDANSQNFMPASGSAVVDGGRVISGFEKPSKGSAPDIGAYEFGGTRWTAGVGAIEDTGAPLSTDSNIYTNLTVYPNPTSNQVVISTPISSASVEIAIFDITGRQLSSSFYPIENGKAILSLLNYAPGIYFVQLNGMQKNVLKIIKE